ncbi:hypothetical protein APR12_006834 [Nocardia amikacinitolerans]|nr:hypothetical protein [Nocardia amikacinitolerans]
MIEVPPPDSDQSRSARRSSDRYGGAPDRPAMEWQELAAVAGSPTPARSRALASVRPASEMKPIRLALDGHDTDTLVSGFLDRFQTGGVVGGDHTAEGTNSTRRRVFADGLLGCRGVSATAVRRVYVGHHTQRRVVGWIVHFRIGTAVRPVLDRRRYYPHRLFTSEDHPVEYPSTERVFGTRRALKVVVGHPDPRNVFVGVCPAEDLRSDGFVTVCQVAQLHHSATPY